MFLVDVIKNSPVSLGAIIAPRALLWLCMKLPLVAVHIIKPRESLETIEFFGVTFD